MERSPLKISKAKKNDATKIYLFGKKIKELNFSSKYPFHELSEIKEFLSKPKENIFLIAEIDGRITGFLFAKILAHSAGGWCMLDNLAVSQNYRNKGLGKQILKEFYKEIKAKKIRYVQILESNNKMTRQFWKNNGYRETKTFIWAEKRL
ncbi:MAG: GNAT family N-acetyltransferase [Candidatus Micrarchaeaceae archaeon]|jgi:GNAT superfamily N-acetyltransferase